jgi:hypothetical protein
MRCRQEKSRKFAEDRQQFGSDIVSAQLDATHAEKEVAEMRAQVMMIPITMLIMIVVVVVVVVLVMVVRFMDATLCSLHAVLWWQLGSITKERDELKSRCTFLVEAHTEVAALRTKVEAQQTVRVRSPSLFAPLRDVFACGHV